jgi:dsDNA-binding SOS-regulon protein
MNHLENAERLFEPLTPAAPAANEYQKERLAMLANFHRLKAKRLARESALTSTAL